MLQDELAQARLVVQRCAEICMQRVQEKVCPAIKRAEKRERSYLFGDSLAPLRSMEQKKLPVRQRGHRPVGVKAGPEIGPKPRAGGCLGVQLD
jgi:hypothetical protein